MTRKEFLAATTAFAAVAGKAAAPQGHKAESTPPKNLPQRNRRPYAGVDWSTALQIKGTTHVHCTSQDDLDVILKRGIEFLTLSNYYPSAPWYPLAMPAVLRPAHKPHFTPVPASPEISLLVPKPWLPIH